MEDIVMRPRNLVTVNRLHQEDCSMNYNNVLVVMKLVDFAVICVTA